MECMAVPLEDCLQPQLRHPSVLHPKRIAFEEDYARLGFERALKKYGLLGWKAEIGACKKHIVRLLLDLLPVMVVQKLKKIRGK